jgi:hypothetical protein
MDLSLGKTAIAYPCVIFCATIHFEANVIVIVLISQLIVIQATPQLGMVACYGLAKYTGAAVARIARIFCTNLDVNLTVLESV